MAAPKSEYEQNARGSGASEELAQEIGTLVVAPLHVVDPDHQGLRFGETGQKVAHGHTRSAKRLRTKFDGHLRSFVVRLGKPAENGKQRRERGRICG